MLSVTNVKLVIYLHKNRHVDDAPLDKRRKLGTGRVMTSITSSQGRQALAPVTTNQKEVAAASSEAQEKQDWMRDYLKRLKVCIKWFQKSLEDLAMEKDNLRNMLDSSERNRVKAGFVKQREVAVKEVGILRGELQKIREDRERQLVLVQELTSELARFKENIGCTVAEVDKLSIKSSALE
ncbi:kinesin-like protein KIN-14C, partial [Tanacetum coccineum]